MTSMYDKQGVSLFPDAHLKLLDFDGSLHLLTCNFCRIQVHMQDTPITESFVVVVMSHHYPSCSVTNDLMVELLRIGKWSDLSFDDTRFIKPKDYCRLANEDLGELAAMSCFYARFPIHGSGFFDKMTFLERLYYLGSAASESANPFETRLKIAVYSENFDESIKTAFPILYAKKNAKDVRFAEAVAILFGKMMKKTFPIVENSSQPTKPLYELTKDDLRNIAHSIFFSFDRCINYQLEQMTDEELSRNVDIKRKRVQAEYDLQMQYLDNVQKAIEDREK